MARHIHNWRSNNDTCVWQCRCDSQEKHVIKQPFSPFGDLIDQRDFNATVAYQESRK